MLAEKTYEMAVKRLFSFMKASGDIQEAYLKAIKFGQSNYLLPVSKFHANDESLIIFLTNWRNQNVGVYPSQFTATPESTSKWLQSGLIDRDDRILFLVVDKIGNILGHLGFNSCLNNDKNFEIDNVIRGVSGHPGIFSEALHALIEWARASLNVESFSLRVMEHNTKAIAFYERSGFIKKREIPLVKSVDGDVTFYSEAKSDQIADKNFIEMSYSPVLPKVEKLILTAGPSISALESTYAFDAAKNGWNSQWSKYLTKFEEEFAEYVGAEYALATSSCTGALQISLMALDIGPGDEVIVPDETWVATANAVRYVGATPIFADVELDTWNLDADSVETLITSKTKAIMPVHMYGHPARMDKLVALARKYDLHIVEDAAPAIGAEWRGQRCGTFGKFAGFSFQGAKLLVTGEGGMLVTSDGDLYEKAKKIWDQGRNPNKTFWIDANGVKYKMSNVQAAIGLGQIQRADELIEMKRRLFSWYEEGLAGVSGIHLNKEVEYARSIYWMTSIRLEEKLTIGRDGLIAALRDRNVDSRPVFPSISQYPIWDKKQKAQPVATRVGKQAMNLPSGVCLKKDEVMYVCKQIRDLVK